MLLSMIKTFESNKNSNATVLKGDVVLIVLLYTLPFLCNLVVVYHSTATALFDVHTERQQ